MEIKNLEKAAQRIKKAIKNKERIVLYGDGDLDGVTSVIILKEAIQNLNGKVSAVYFPDREVEGYGLSEKGIEYLKQFAPALLVVLDCGITNFKEIKVGKETGFEIIIVDHHQVLDKLPEADIIVDPHQKDDPYPFKELAAAGIVFKLAEKLLGNEIPPLLRNNFLELVALATLADMMPKEEENIIFISEGIEAIKRSWRPAILAFKEVDYFKTIPTLKDKLSKFISILNVRDVEDNLPAAFRLLTTTSIQEAKNLIEKLYEKAQDRKKRIEEILKIVEERISKKEEKIIFEGDENFDFILISPVASILFQKYKKPTFIYKKLEKETQGTVRTPEGINGVELMKKCADLLISYGGHPRASGFRIKNEDLDSFKVCLMKAIEETKKV